MLAAAELDTGSPDCAIAIRQLTAVLQTTREFIEQCFTNEEAAPIDSHNALPKNRKSLAFIQTLLKHNLSPSTISDAIDAVEDLLCDVTWYREEAESAFRHLWRLYCIQSFRRPLRRDSSESFASVARSFRKPLRRDSIESFASVSSIRTLESIATRIVACSSHYVDADAEPVDESQDPVQWLKEQAFRTDLQPPPASVHALSDYEGEDLAHIYIYDSNVSISLRTRLILLKL